MPYGVSCRSVFKPNNANETALPRHASSPGKTMRALALVLMIAASPAAASDNLPRQDCSAEFISRWRSDAERAMRDMPKAPCWMKTQSGPYVCAKDGCVRAHVYFEG